MKKLKVLDDYKLSSTINCLQSVNNIFILFAYNEKEGQIKDSTIENTNENTNSINNDEKTTSIIKSLVHLVQQNVLDLTYNT